ncbi:hypothetical protein EVAR_962_1 [Eumeta japonica]|uniref:Uncharacterized protein n=1 Tax=Eumeta variegata TaxID=151549 RepID=A0A4C1SDZ2_EUMVA|nr:hypothetical protein EVAR_962_1 [Eumeta japonica]
MRIIVVVMEKHGIIAPANRDTGEQTCICAFGVMGKFGVSLTNHDMCIRRVRIWNDLSSPSTPLVVHGMTCVFPNDRKCSGDSFMVVDMQSPIVCERCHRVGDNGRYSTNCASMDGLISISYNMKEKDCRMAYFSSGAN